MPLPDDLAWAVAGTGDFDGDGKHDVLLRHSDGRWRLYPMNGPTIAAGGGEPDLTRNPAATVAGIGDLNGDGCADGADYEILVDLAGTGGFRAEDTIAVAPVQAAGGWLLLAAPSETLAEGSERGFAVRLRERKDDADESSDERLSNALSFTLRGTEVHPEIAGHPTAILDVVLRAAYESLDDPLLTVDAGAIAPGRSLRSAAALDLGTAYSDAQAEALLRSLFGVSLIAPSTVRCEPEVPEARCEAYRRSRAAIRNWWSKPSAKPPRTVWLKPRRMRSSPWSRNPTTTGGMPRP